MNNYLLIAIVLTLIIIFSYVYIKYGQGWFKKHKKTTTSAIAISIITASMGMLLFTGDIVSEGDADVNIVWYTSSARNAYFTTNTSVHFSTIVLDPDYVQFNSSKFKIDSDNRINVTIMNLADFYANTTSGTVWFNISGFTIGSLYNIYIDNALSTSVVANSTGYVSFSNAVWSEPHFEIRLSTTTDYNTTIRTNGVDYFPWLGVNTSAYAVADLIDNESEITWSSGEYIALWVHGLTWSQNWSTNGAWQEYHPHNDSGVNFSIHTLNAVRVYTTDNNGNCMFNMTSNTNINYTESKNYTLANASMNKGFNYTVFNNATSTTLSAVNTSIGLAEYYWVALWNETNYEWDAYVSYWEFIDKPVHQWSIVETKVSTTRYWET